MKKIFLLEDDSLVIMLAQIWAEDNKFQLIVFSSWDELINNNFNKNDFCIVDYSMLPLKDSGLISLIKLLNTITNIIVTSGYDKPPIDLGLRIYSKNAALKHVEDFIKHLNVTCE